MSKTIAPGRVWWSEKRSGKRRSKVIRGTLEEAKALRDAMRHTQTTGEYVSPATITVDQTIERWLAKVAVTRSASPRRREAIEESTRQGYAAKLSGTIREHLGPILFQELAPCDIDAYHSWALENEVTRLGRPVSPNTLRKRHAALKLVLDWAITQGLIKHNAANLTAPPAEVRVKRQAFTVEDVGKILAEAAGTDLELPVLLAVRTGLRLGEVLGLRWEAVRLEDREIKVQTTVTEAPTLALKPYPKTSASAATLKIGPELARLLKEHKRAQAAMIQAKRAEVAASLPAGAPDELIAAMHAEAWSDLGLVFCTPRGGLLRPSDVSRDFTAVLRALEEHEEITRRIVTRGASFHSLRHTHATTLVGAGKSIDKVQRRMRHKSAQVTIEFYLHAQPGEDDDLAEIAEAAFVAHDQATMHTKCTFPDAKAETQERVSAGR